MIGRVLGGRYEILERAGGGGMAVVYRALDTYLHRQVAVKVLRSQLAADEEVVARFRREALAAARLTDPRIVSVYDVGRDRDTYYIVMEYVSGMTLKEKIRREGALSPKEAALVAVEVLEALSHAHGEGLIHRDIKPQNIILTHDGRVKVADFGIARAVGHGTMTAGERIMGSAHYLAPEQALGKAVDARTDIYALGVVLYEMLAGEPPFQGESPLAVAMQHVQGSPPSLAEKRPALPKELVAIVERAMERDPERRFPSADAMKEALESYLSGGKLPHVAPPPPPSPEKEKRSRRRIWRWILVAGLLGLLGGAAFYGLRAWLNVPEVVVPDVREMSLADAQATLEEAGLGFLIGPAQYSDTIPPNYVADQEPPPGTSVKKGQRVTLYPSQGPEWVEGGVPDVRGMSLRDARVILANHRLESDVERQYDDEVAKESVITTRPGPGEPIRVGDRVVLVVSLGPQPRPVTVPDVVGLTAEEAQSQLEEVGLKVGEVTARLSGQPKDVVVEQSPQAGSSLMAGESVNLVVSAGCENSQTFQVMPPAERYTGDVTVVAYVQDREGRRKIFQGTTPAGTAITLPVCWAGEHGALQIYFNGELAQVVALQ